MQLEAFTPASLKALEDRLWEAADDLRANSSLSAQQYSTPVLGLIFLRYAEARYLQAMEQIEAEEAGDRFGPDLSPEAFQARGVMVVPEDALYSSIQHLPEGADLGKALNEAMKAIEGANPVLKDVLPKTYQRIDNGTLATLLKTISWIPVHIEGDAFGQIYEYFLGKFALSAGRGGGEFFTPTSIVKLIVEIMEPFRGRVFDPACGSGGMFVQSAQFVEEHAGSPGADLSLYGQEKTSETVRLAKMNLAVHGLEGTIRDIVIARTGATTGYAKYIKGEHDSVFASYLVRLRIDPAHDARFVGYIVESQEYKDFITLHRGGAAQPNANAQVLSSYPVDLPPVETQRRIAGILSAYDDLIETNTRRIRVLEAMARALYREWFVHYRFPGHEAVPLVEHADLGEVPEGWEVKKLFDVAEGQYGFAFKSRQFNETGEGQRIVRIRNVKTNSSDTFTTEEADERYSILNGDILVGMDGDFHMCRWAGGDALLVQRVARFRPLGDLPRYYLFQALEAPVVRFNSIIIGTTVAHLGHKHLKTIRMAVPPKPLLDKVRDQLDPLYDLEQALRLKNNNLRQTRDLLLPRLVSGALPVEAAEAELAEAA